MNARIGFGRCSALTWLARLALLGAICWAAGPSYGAPSVGISTVPNPTKSFAPAIGAALVCPNYNGLLDSISVPVSQQIGLYVVVSTPAPSGGATFQLSSGNPAVAAAGDRKQAFLPQVYIPQGQTSSNQFYIFGVGVGATQLRIVPLTPGYSASAFPLGAWDINASGTNKFVDANPPAGHCRVSDSSSDLSTDTAVIAHCGSSVRTGIAADGASRLLLRSISGLPGTACFQITSQSSFEQGTLADSVVQSSALSGRYYGFTYYQAPETFGDSAGYRTLEVEFAFTPSIGNGNTSRFRAQTRIVRPPVLLVHGIWSNRSAWSKDYVKEDANRTTFVADYGATNAASYSDNYPRIQGFAKLAIDNARAKGYAVTRTDVMGHSMGGVLTRLYIGSAKFKRPDNLGVGDIRRLVTLDTPHSGSSFANLIVALHRLSPAETDKAVRDITDNAPEGGALCDLAENSPALQGLNGGTAIDATPITGTGGPGVGTYNTESARFFGGAFGFGNIEATLTKTRCVHRNAFFRCDLEESVFPRDVVDRFRFRQANDAVVGLGSQQGGLTSTNFASVIHSGPSMVNGILNVGAVANQAYSLLDGPVAGSGVGFNDFPGVGSDGTGVSASVPGQVADKDRADYADQCSPGKALKPAAISQALALGAQAGSVPDTRVRIISPAAGQAFAPGDTVSIVVSLTPPLVANDIAVSRSGGLSELAGTNYDGTRYEASFVVPDWIAGPLVLTPRITDTSNTPLQGPSVTIAIRPTLPPQRIAFLQKNYHVTLPTDVRSESLALIGTYAGGIDRDITSAAAGTSYRTSNPAAVEVSDDGVYLIVGSGTAVITGFNAGLEDTATFVIDDSVNPLPPEDVTSGLSIQQSGFRLDRTTGFFVQSVTIGNRGADPVPGPLYMVLRGMPAGVNLVNQSGISGQIAVGSPYMTLPLGADGLTLAPGEAVTLALQFLNPSRVSVTYSASVWRTADMP